jgi:hypothetical protein
MKNETGKKEEYKERRKGRGNLRRNLIRNRKEH